MPSRFLVPDPDAPPPPEPEHVTIARTLTAVRRAVLSLPIDDNGNVHRRDVLELLDDGPDL
jgi:hypothetical protein